MGFVTLSDYHGQRRAQQTDRWAPPHTHAHTHTPTSTRLDAIRSSFWTIDGRSIHHHLHNTGVHRDIMRLITLRIDTRERFQRYDSTTGSILTPLHTLFMKRISVQHNTALKHSIHSHMIVILCDGVRLSALRNIHRYIIGYVSVIVPRWVNSEGEHSTGTRGLHHTCFPTYAPCSSCVDNRVFSYEFLP